MGDGAVVCMPLSERFAVSETSWSGRVFGRSTGKEMKDLEKGEQSEEAEEVFPKGELENGEFAQEQGEPDRNGELENGEFVPESGHMVELEMGEFVPEEWGKHEEIKLEQKPESSRISELEREERKTDRQKSHEDHYRRRERDRRGDRRGRTPENYHRRREDRRRIDSEERKRGGNEAKTATDSHKHGSADGKHHGRDSSTIIQRKHHGDSEGSSASKIRRISGDNLHSSSSIPSRTSFSSRYSSSRCPNSPLPSRAHDRYTKSHHDRSHHHNYRDQTPSYRDRSPRDRSRRNDSRERKTPANSDRSPQNSIHRHDVSEKRHVRHEEKPRRRESDMKDSPTHRSTRPEKDRTSQKNVSQSRELLPPPPPISTPLPTPLPVPENGFLEYHHLSMEEDMDICDTPPHSSNRAEDNSGKWYYLDEFGLERGPSKLSDLKRLVEEGVLSSDHLIKHFDSDRWVTVENAASPLVSVNSISIVSDAVTRMASPPEAPGNTSIDGADMVVEKPTLTFQPENNWNYIEPPEGFRIDERVQALLDGREIIPGEEIETIGKALKTSFEHVEWENWGQSEGFTRSRGYALEIPRFLREDGPNKYHDGFAPTLDRDPSFSSSDSTDLFSGRWSCKGGDWKRNDDIMVERCQKRKLVLNEGFPLCQMPKSGDDPRRQLKDELYFSASDKKLDLPTWAFSCIDDKNDNGGDSTKSRIQTKNPVIRGVKGIMLPVVRINACVAKDRTFSPDPHPKPKPARSSRSLSVGSDKNPSADITPQIKKGIPQSNSGSVKNHKDRICTIDELSVDTGGWFYLDGKGREHGPFLHLELQELVSKGTILKNSSVFRKLDNIWIPVANSSKDERRQKSKRSTSDSVPLNRTNDVSFNKLYPQFIGYTRGKLHELVMKSYKSREFAAAIHEVLDPWISAKQPKKEMERHFPFNSSITKSSVVLSHDAPTERFWSTDADGSGSYGHTGKRVRLLLDGSDEDQELEDHSFEDLWGVRDVGNVTNSENFSAGDSWGMLNNNILARVFHFLRADAKSLSLSAATCKHWRAAVQSYKDISKQVDLSSLGSSCTDSTLKSIMCGYDKSMIVSLALSKCTHISASTLEEILHSFTNIASVDIRSCNQFKELTDSFQNIKWIRNRSSQIIKSLKWVTDKSLTPSRSSKEVNGDELTSSKDAVVPTFWQGFYKRTRLPDARKSSSASTRHAQLRQLLRKKSVTAYRKMEEFIRSRLKEIMKGNSFELFAFRVAEIEDKMRSGHYERHGLSSIKEDISRMCRDALKLKKKGDSGEMRNTIMLFVQLAKRLEDSKSTSHKKDESSKSFRERLDAGLSEGSRHKKKSSSRLAGDKKGPGKSQRSTNGGLDHESTAIDREVKKSLAKLNRRHTYSDSETSEENDLYDTVTDSDGKTSDTDGEPESRLEKSTEEAKESTFTWDDSLDDREWGARMTKASLVPPVTRKYEVIDRYLIVADEEQVKRKMSVSLPEDYEEKLQAQKSGLDETDMQIPEVKDYKPRKMLGVEVIEQEVYGIDPYTHNLLLDSMPDDADWLLVDKQNFIEEVLLRVLNKQTRHLTGSGNTPMVYHLKSVVEEIKKNAEEDGDSRLVKLSSSILKAMQTRPDDNYVAYRKGLGVVCNKDGGFGDDDFVVEFLGEVYPAWKWFEKQDGIRSLQKNNKDPAPEFYNIYLERPKGDRDGYDLVVVDAMHKANYASRICHSCRPNCEAKVTAVDGQYQIGIYAVRPIAYGEEITFDYNSVTESKEEYEASVCLCGSQVCRGSYLNLTGEDAFHNVLKDCHGLLDRHKLMLESCEANFVSQEDYMDLGRAGLGTCLLDGLPDWLIAYSARLVRFMNFERTRLPEEILKHNLEEKRKFFSDICIETEKIEAENQAEGVYNQRLQNLALTLDKVRYVMRCAFGDPKRAPPPLQRLLPEELVAEIWTGEESLVEELLQCLNRYLQSSAMDELRSKVLAHTPSGSDLASELKKSLLWLRDELQTIPCTQRCRNDAAADLLHLYAYTKCFFRTREYKVVRSPPVYISPLDLGPKYVEKMGAGFQEYCKDYGENYCLGQLIFWHNQTSAEPDSALVRARRGCLLLPDLSSFFPMDSTPPLYGPRTVRFMLSRMEKQPQRPWPKDQIWQFKSSPRLLGSPMLDAVLAGGHPLDKDMIHWLKTRSSLYDLS